MTPAQVNAIVSELLCLAATLDPDGNWDCDDLCNLSAAFTAWAANPNGNFAFRNLDNTTGPRGKITPSLQNGNANSLLENGTWVLWGSPVNTPVPDLTYIVQTIVDDTLQWVTQYAFEVSGDSETDSKRWKRERNAGVWGPWYRVYQTPVEIANGICATDAAGDTLAACMRSVDANNALAMGSDGRLFVPVAADIIPPGMTAAFDRNTAPAGWLKNNGALLLRTTYAALDAAIYCGDANNPTAEWGYRTNSTDTVRSTTGTHIRLRDSRGEFTRGWDDGRGVDSGRSLWAAQAQAFQSHNHSINDPAHTHLLAGGPNAPGSGTAAPAAQSGTPGYISGLQSALTGVTVLSAGGTETRPRNQAALICIKY